MKVGSTTLLRSAPGLSWDMRWDRTTFQSARLCFLSMLAMSGSPVVGGRTISLIGLDHLGVVFERVRSFAGGSAAWIKDVLVSQN